MYTLNSDIKFLKGVGEKRSQLFNLHLSIYSLNDLLNYFPYRHIDRSKLFRIADIPETDSYIQFKGKILKFTDTNNSKAKILSAKVFDESGETEIIWFSGHQWIKEKYKVGIEYLFFGKPNIFNRKINFAHPEIEPVENYYTKHNFTFYPIYSIPEKLKKTNVTSKTIQTLIEQAFELVSEQIEDFYTAEFCNKHNLIPLRQALENIHFPHSHDLLSKSERRLKFDELFIIQIDMLQQFKLRKLHVDGIKMPKIGAIFKEFYNKNLPFELTKAQKRVVREIYENIKSGEQMNRLLQGDVGSGKTLVALMSALIAADNGYQSCMMAPTEILAKQHFENIKKMTEGLPFEVSILTGSTKKKERVNVLTDLNIGKIQFLIGTHALIEDPVVFKNLGVVIVDEQHRFGVMQRAKLWKKGEQTPHILVATATPIPRTLAMTVYGDLDISIIDELPPGRKPIQTVHYYENKREQIYDFLRSQIAMGSQIYCVFPLIKESEKLDYQNIEEGYERISKVFGNNQVVMVHGKMKPDEKSAAMTRFINKEANIMMATTVIEVGVDVPNASVMLIESSERFGLAQLHQLRGRVGRGAKQSYCILLSSFKLSTESRKRISIMTKTNDGFIIAEEDLKLRGYGDIEGTRQSGLPFELKIAHLGKDHILLEYARKVATQIIENDPNLENPENQLLKNNIQYKKNKTVNLGMIS